MRPRTARGRYLSVDHSNLIGKAGGVQALQAFRAAHGGLSTLRSEAEREADKYAASALENLEAFASGSPSPMASPKVSLSLGEVTFGEV